MERKRAEDAIRARLDSHNSKRLAIQNELRDICDKLVTDVHELEPRIENKLEKVFNAEDLRLHNIIQKITVAIASTDLHQEQKMELEREVINELGTPCQSYAIGINDQTIEINKRFFLQVITEHHKEAEKKDMQLNDLLIELKNKLSKHYDSKLRLYDDLFNLCNTLKEEIRSLYVNINTSLENFFTAEDARFQCLFNEKDTEKVWAELLLEHSYKINKNEKAKTLGSSYDLDVHKTLYNFRARAPEDVCLQLTDSKKLKLTYNFFTKPEESVLTRFNMMDSIFVLVSIKDENEKETLHTLRVNEKEFSQKDLSAEATYYITARMMHNEETSAWSKATEMTTGDFSSCAWRECPNEVKRSLQYATDESHRTAKNIGSNWCTIIGDIGVPLNKVSSWNVRVVDSRNGNSDYFLVGVAPFDISQNEMFNFSRYGWYFHCFYSSLYSGPPHNFRDKAYGLRKRNGQYVHTGDSVGVVMDTAKGELSFVVNGANLGVAFDGIPLDKPLVPCCILRENGDSVELDTSEVKENVNSSIPVPSNFQLKETWNSISLSWDAVEGASAYQIEVNEDKEWKVPQGPFFRVSGLLPKTEVKFRVRAIYENKVSKWSDVIKGTSKEIPLFSWCTFKICEENIYVDRRYSLDTKTRRTATNIGNNTFCTVIGNTPLPLNQVTSWGIKILKSTKNDGRDIYIGIAPFDIDQNIYGGAFKSCGWYFDCYYSALRSGPPHNIRKKKYGPRKGEGKYVHTGDSVGIVMDTAKGELSFVVSGVSFGVAFEGIPLDKPLVPCVILCYQGDSVELDTSEVKENVNSSISVSSNITAKSTTWDSITLSWDAVEGASFYQIELDGNKLYYTRENIFIGKGFLPETEHSFRVRVARGSEVSKWNDAVKGRTQKVPEFSGCTWKECTGYSFSEKSLRAATKTKIGWQKIIGSLCLPRGKPSFGVKILSAKGTKYRKALVGVAPSDTNQSSVPNHQESGWYLKLSTLTLFSGPPHNYNGKKYGPRNEDSITCDSVGVMMDTAKGELSFVVNGANLGVAYKEIPLDKPLVPCIALYEEGDSVELDIPEGGNDEQ